MSSIPNGTERMQPFVPAKDFDRSKRFYETLGFNKVLDGEVAIFNASSSGFILQRYYKKEWSENSVIQIMVDDLGAWWAHIDSLDSPSEYQVRPQTAPTMPPWGLCVAFVYDPRGGLWRAAQRRDRVIQDP